MWTTWYDASSIGHNLVDVGDGTAQALATGTLGTANVHGEATLPAGQVITGDMQIVVVVGLAERATMVAGEPFEVTPDVRAFPPLPRGSILYSGGAPSFILWAWRP